MGLKRKLVVLALLGFQFFILMMTWFVMLAWHAKVSMPRYEQEMRTEIEALIADGELQSPDGNDDLSSVSISLASAAQTASSRMTGNTEMVSAIGMGLCAIAFVLVLWPSRRSPPASPS